LQRIVFSNKRLYLLLANPLCHFM